MRLRKGSSTNVSVVVWLVCILSVVAAFPDQGKWDFVMSQDKHTVIVPKSMLAGSMIFVRITCASLNEKLMVRIQSALTQTPCLFEHATYFENSIPFSGNQSYQSVPQDDLCSNDNHIILKPVIFSEETPAAGGAAPIEPQQPIQSSATKRDVSNNNNPEPVSETLVVKKSNNPGAQSVEKPVFTIPKDGVYLFMLRIMADDDFSADVHIRMISTHGYLSAADYPLLPFYGAMCLVYLVLGLIWLFVSFKQWRDLLRIQFWIGAVILLGMMEKAMFYAEYQSINTNGYSVRGAVLLAEWVSCAKRTLARMLVVIVSLGFGIVKPRLGPMLHRVVGTGALYFVLACVEGYLRVMNTKNDPSNQILVASIPLAVLDSAICWWIFTSLVQTTRTLRLRRNMVKLALYRHFTNTLIFAVVASVVFMLFSIKTHRLAPCLTDWKELWQDEAFWHLLFSCLLLVIMILWRPTNNNQRYAFTPLLDNPEDEDEDEEEQFVADAYGVKMRGQRSASPKPSSRATTNEEDDLRWVEENIPQAIADAALPVLDSDEEIINTKFEVSKMQ